MKIRLSSFAPVIAFSMFSPSLAAAAAPVPPVLQSLDGAPTLTVSGSDGGSREVKQGDTLQFGDTIATSEHVAATVAFEQGAQVIVSTDSKVQVNQESEEAGEPPVPIVDVFEGDIHAVVENYQGGSAPVADTPPAAGASPAPVIKSHRFLIRTKSAVMGVRGTDFYVSANGDQYTLNTVSGTVETADSLKNFKGSSMVSVGAGQYLTPEGAKPFAVREFLQTYGLKHLQSSVLYSKALLDAANGSLARKFALARTNGGDSLQLKGGNDPREISFPGKKKASPTPNPVPSSH